MISPVPSLEDRLIETAYRPSGFDYMRLLLAGCVLVIHCFMLTASPSLLPPVLQHMVVPMFFAVSGFLVAGSLERSRSLFVFFGLRAFRIFPALGFEVLFSALLLGPLMTRLPLGEYLADPLFRRYFLNFFGYIQDYLPGVFESNPDKLVNGQLWTVPFELIAYVVLGILAFLTVYRNAMLFLALVVAAHLFQAANIVLRPNPGFQGAGGASVIVIFLAGALLYRFRSNIRFSPWLAALAALAYVALFMLVPNGIKLAAIPIAYLTVYLGLLDPPRNVIVSSGDYSYGTYLLGYPVQQFVVAVIPFGTFWLSNLLISIVITGCLAVFSWHFIEKQVLARKKILNIVAERGWPVMQTLGSRLKQRG